MLASSARLALLLALTTRAAGFAAAPSCRCCARTAAAAVCMRMPWEPVVTESDDEDEKVTKEVKKGIDFSGLAQLVTMGAGAPMLGDLKKVNFDKSEAEGGAALQFELEANNFEDERGDIKKGTYRDEGYVDPDYVDPMESLKKMWPFGK